MIHKICQSEKKKNRKNQRRNPRFPKFLPQGSGAGRLKSVIPQRRQPVIKISPRRQPRLK